MESNAKPGRPVRAPGAEVYEALLDAAEVCLKSSRYSQITVRQVAKLAGVNPSMINYYFNGKKGLFVGLIGHVFNEWRESLNQIGLAMKSASFDPIRALVASIDKSFYRHASVIFLLTYEVAQKDSDVREAYFQFHASRTSGALRAFIETGTHFGHFRRNPHVGFTSLTIMNLALHPIAIGDNMLPAYGFGQEALLSQEWRSFLEKTLRDMLC